MNYRFVPHDVGSFILLNITDADTEPALLAPKKIFASIKMKTQEADGEKQTITIPNIIYTDETQKKPTADQIRVQEVGAGKEQTAVMNKITYTPTIAPSQVLPRPHPRAGARHANGTFGYVADLTLVRRNYLQEVYRLRNSSDHRSPSLTSFLKLSNNEFDAVCNAPPESGFEQSGYKLLMKVLVNAPDPVPENAIAQEFTVPYQRSSKRPRILCAVYTHPGNHHLVEAIIDTWGWRCDGFIAASTITNQTIGAVDIPHLGPEVYDNMWQKMRSFRSYIHDNYLDDYDFFYFGGSDVQLIFENLRNYLWSVRDSIGEERLLTETLLLGSAAPWPWGQVKDNIGEYFIHGAGGYVMNRVTLKKTMHEKFLACYGGKIDQDAEDRVLSKCFKYLHIKGNDTVDAQGSNRFHYESPRYIARLDYERYERIKATKWRSRVVELYILRNGKRWKSDAVSTQTIAFHNVKYPIAMKRLHAILYRSCPVNTVLHTALLK